MFNPFVIIRSKIRDAVVAGFADGLAVIDQEVGNVLDPVPDALLQRLRLSAAPPALPQSSAPPAAVEPALASAPPVEAPAGPEATTEENGHGRRRRAVA